MGHIHSNNYLFFSMILMIMLRMNSAQLSSSFYTSTCPKVLSIVRTVVFNAVAKEHRMGASLLRLHFHDCFVNGCDGSVLLDDNGNFVGEKTAKPNANSLRGFEVIDMVKSQLESLCPGVVSCSDILAVAARDSVVALGGPAWTVQLGRRDSTSASLNSANTELPSPFLDLGDLISAFSTKGFTPAEMVALSGGHTIGQAKCSIFRNRIYNDTNIDTTLAASLKSNCPSSGSDENLSALDATTPIIFDNSFYKNLMNNKGLLHSDQQLFGGGSTDSQVSSYSSTPAKFYVDFSKAMVKMGNLGSLLGTNGEIRTDCRMINH